MICNSGIGLIPRVDGEVDQFTEKGLYDGLFLMADAKTNSYWNHMTGEAVYGPLAGTRLELENLLHTTVEQALAEDPETIVAISSHPGAIMRYSQAGTLASLLARIIDVPEFFPQTIAREDDRLERMDIGIGIWGDTGLARYYSKVTVDDNQRFVFDSFEGRGTLVYYDPTAHALQALYTDAEGARWDGAILRLSNGQRIEKGVLFEADGSRAEVERPLQVFTRWYGFSLTFPDTEIFEGG